VPALGLVGAAILVLGLDTALVGLRPYWQVMGRQCYQRECFACRPCRTGVHGRHDPRVPGRQEPVWGPAGELGEAGGTSCRRLQWGHGLLHLMRDGTGLPFTCKAPLAPGSQVCMLCTSPPTQFAALRADFFL